MAGRPLTNNQKLGYALALAYTAVGLLGFTVTGGTDFADASGVRALRLFTLNPFHNVVHLLVALVLLAGLSSGSVGARRVNRTMGFVYLAAGIYGIVAAGSAANVIAANLADNLLHLGSGAVLVAMGSRRKAARLSPA